MSVLSVFGLAMVIIGVYELLGVAFRLLRCNRQVTGKVAYVDTKPEIGASGHGFTDCYFPVYEYEVDGKVYQQSGAEYSSRQDSFKVGEQKQIRYNPNNPNECIIDRKSNKIVIGIILLAVGVAVMLFV